MAFYPLCPDLPIEEIKYLIPGLRGTQPFQWPKASWAAVNVLGYASSKAQTQSLALHPLTGGELADHLEALLPSNETSVRLIPWDRIIAAIIELIFKKLFPSGG